MLHSLRTSSENPINHTRPLLLPEANMQQLHRFNCSANRQRSACPAAQALQHRTHLLRGPHSSAIQRPPVKHVVRAEPEQGGSSDEDLQKKFFSTPGEQQQQQQRKQQQQNGSSRQQEQQQNIIDNVNPYELGRQARRAFDDVWGQLSSITSPTKSYVFDDILDPTLSLEEDAESQDTTVLVVGATGRVGRILIRKLLLRGYKVKALIRLREGIRESKEDLQGLPNAVEIVIGDVGELKACQTAIRGVDKVSTGGDRQRDRGRERQIGS